MLYIPQSFVTHLEVPSPEFLYHYTGQTGFLGIIQGEELHATKIQFMNDSTEFSATLSLTRELLRTLKPPNALSQKSLIYTAFEQSLQGLEDINIFAACFCEDGDLLSQWRGYTGASGGYAVGFDTTLLRKIIVDDGFTLSRCVYDIEFQKIILTEAITHCVKEEIAGRSQWAFKGPLVDGR
jgi:hypothetical protein